MFAKTALFLQFVHLQKIFSTVNGKFQNDVAPNTAEPPKLYEKPNRITFELDSNKLVSSRLESMVQDHFNKMENQLEKMEKEISVLKEQNNQFASFQTFLTNDVQTQFQKQNEQLKLLEELLRKQPTLPPPRNCKDVQDRGYTVSGVYMIKPDGASASFEVWCDMETRGGGWIYVINRFDGSLDFNLSWTDYKNGFGNLSGEHWLGLEHLYLLTKNKPNELLIELVDQDSKKAYAHYDKFSIGDEDEGYPIKIIEGYSGDAGDDFSAHLGWKFTTIDRDQDTDKENCAVVEGGGGWYTDCYYCLFTGTYNTKGIRCYTFRGYDVRLKEVKLMIRY